MAGTIIPILAYANTNTKEGEQTMLNKFCQEKYPGKKILDDEMIQDFFEHLTWNFGWDPAIEEKDAALCLWHSCRQDGTKLLSEVKLPDGQTGYMYGSELCCDNNEPYPGYMLNDVDERDFVFVGFRHRDNAIDFSFTTNEEMEKCYHEMPGRFVNYPVVNHENVESLKTDGFNAESEKETAYISNTLSNILKDHPEIETVTFRKYRWMEI